jgi:predicted Fe-Mo cluster-binding NifX family protein
MKICIPVERNEGVSSKVSAHFGSAPYFAIHDLEANTTEFVCNENQHHTHGMCQPLDALNGKVINAVVCGGMGARAVARLNEGGIKAYRVAGGTVSEILATFTAGGLEEITAVNACANHGCH